MIPASLLIVVNALLLHLVDLGCGWLIGLSRPVENDRHLNLVVVGALTLNSITNCLLLTIKDDSKGLDRPSRSLLDGGVTAGEYADPVSAGQSYSLALQVRKLLLISAIIELAFERQAIGEDVKIEQSIEHVEGWRLIPPSL